MRKKATEKKKSKTDTIAEPTYSLGFESLIREVTADPDIRVWAVVHLLSQADKLNQTERQLAATCVALALVRQRRLLEVASELLDEAAASGPRHLVMEGQAQLAEVRGDLIKASALRHLAAGAADAPSAAEALQSEWASQEIKWRAQDSSAEGKRKRLDAYFKAHKKLSGRTEEEP